MSCMADPSVLLMCQFCQACGVLIRGDELDIERLMVVPGSN